MNPLDEYPQLRKILYLVQWVVSALLFIITAVVLVVTDGDVPTWLAATTAGFNAFTALTGRTAETRVSDPETDVEELTDEDGEDWSTYEDDEDELEGAEVDYAPGDLELDLKLNKE